MEARVYRPRTSAEPIDFMTAHMRLARPLVSSIRKALTKNALPGETEGLTTATEKEAAEFLASVGSSRKRGEVAIAIESTGGEAGRRRMRIGIVNDDMPFLVDSVANAIAGRQLTIHRLLHPVVCVDRDKNGKLLAVEPLCGDKERRAEHREEPEGPHAAVPGRGGARSAVTRAAGQRPGSFGSCEGSGWASSNWWRMR